MFCAGDEFLNTQRGNNNPYNQDNETTWLDWSLLEKHRDIFRFFQRMISFARAGAPSRPAATGVKTCAGTARMGQ
jgi:glycogen operon protein